MTNLIGISGKLQSGKDTVTKIIQWLLLNQDRDTEIPFDRFDLYKEEVTWKNIKFADKLKDMICLLLGCTREQLEDPTFKEIPLGEEWVKYELSYVSHDRLSYCSCSKYYKKYFCSKEEAIEYIEGDLEVDQDSIEISKIELTPRLLLQLLGTECGRDIIHLNIWVNSTMSNFTKDSNWVISDVRFPNEAKAIKDKGGILIRVDRDFTPKEGDEIQIKVFSNWSKVLYSHTDNNGYHYGHGSDGYKYKSTLIKPIIDNHFSEIALDDYNDWDYVIDNNGTIEDLIEKVKEILIIEELLKK